MQFLQLPGGPDRLVLESLLIARYDAAENAKPAAKPISELFPE
jgi:hypothetical protein